ncbi:MFS transporter [Acidiphilium sp. JA12-A1]|uniref:MFS transporter n=1 Tax=Acidiphilium sp. JA12-A1 TaxID=1464546 RepID=UPI0004616BC7|nr:MFS transporter [Acidiphilium sp. JA12-A1]KDM68383.1 general substrate transporter [Acidiphilium sp. JA12-A1]
MSTSTSAASLPSVENTVSEALNQVVFSPFHLRAIFAAGMGFFASAYDLFIIGTALTLIKGEWHLSPGSVALIGSISLAATFVGAFVFGRTADIFGRKSIYGLEALLMTVGALLSAFAPNVAILLIARVILGFGIGGDYPLSAVLMSEYSNTKSRGRMVSLVFSTQAAGLVVGPAIALTLLAAGIDHDIAWRIMLGLGALPAAMVIYIRRTLPESPRWLARVKGDGTRAARELASFSLGTATSAGRDKVVKQPFSRYLLTFLGTAGAWFVFDYAYYGNTISTPMIMQQIAPHASLLTSTAMSLIIFAVAAVPGYILAILTVDRIGHKRLQLIGFAGMGLMFLIIGLFPALISTIGLFLIVYGLSYFFAEFGPNTTTFLLSSEVFPVNIRTTGHGASAGVAKVGAFIGAFIFPILITDFGLYGTLRITFVFSMVGLALTAVCLREPAGLSLEAASNETTDEAAVSPMMAGASST